MRICLNDYFDVINHSKYGLKLETQFSANTLEQYFLLGYLSTPFSDGLFFAFFVLFIGSYSFLLDLISYWLFNILRIKIQTYCNFLFYVSFRVSSRSPRTSGRSRTTKRWPADRLRTSRETNRKSEWISVRTWQSRLLLVSHVSSFVFRLVGMKISELNELFCFWPFLLMFVL